MDEESAAAAAVKAALAPFRNNFVPVDLHVHFRATVGRLTSIRWHSFADL